MSDESAPNGFASGSTTPILPKMSGLALTEYAATPTPPGERNEQTGPGLPPNWGIPEAFLLPNGYPDVRSINPVEQIGLMLTCGFGYLVSAIDLDFPRLRCY
jgi:hypothetical protein